MKHALEYYAGYINAVFSFHNTTYGLLTFVLLKIDCPNWILLFMALVLVNMLHGTYKECLWIYRSRNMNEPEPNLEYHFSEWQNEIWQEVFDNTDNIMTEHPISEEVLSELRSKYTINRNLSAPESFEFDSPKLNKDE